jgi:hypothetical protein
MAKGRKTGGRQKGAVNKAAARAELAEISAKTGRTAQGTMALRMNFYMDKFEAYMAAARDVTLAPEVLARFLAAAEAYLDKAHDAAKDLGPYQAPRLSAVKVGGEAVLPGLTINLVNFKKEDCIPTRPLKEIEHETKLID